MTPKIERCGEITYLTFQTPIVIRTTGVSIWNTGIYDIPVTTLEFEIVREDGGEEWASAYINYDLSNLHEDVADAIYGDDAWMHAYHEHLVSLGFERALVEKLDFSERGMQSDGIVDCDADELGLALFDLHCKETV